MHQSRPGQWQMRLRQMGVLLATVVLSQWIAAAPGSEACPSSPRTFEPGTGAQLPVAGDDASLAARAREATSHPDASSQSSSTMLPVDRASELTAAMIRSVREGDASREPARDEDSPIELASLSTRASNVFAGSAAPAQPRYRSMQSGKREGGILIPITPESEPEPAPEPEPDQEPAPDPAPNPLLPRATDSLVVMEAESLRPGDWRNLSDKTWWPGKEDGRSFKAFQRVQNIDGPGGADGMGWTEDLIYNNGSLVMLLMRSNMTHGVMGMAADGIFWRQDTIGAFNPSRRPFNKLVTDGEYLYHAPRDDKERMGYFVRAPLNDPTALERYGVPIGDDQMDSVGNFAIEWVPEWGRFYAYTPGGKIWTWTHGEEQWTRIATPPRLVDDPSTADPNDRKPGRPSGFSGNLIWNPVKRELLAIGGQVFGNNPQTGYMAMRLTEPMGEAVRTKDMQKPDGSPLVYSSSAQDKVIVDKRNGGYLYIDGDKTAYYNTEIGGRYVEYDYLDRHRRDDNRWILGNYELYAPYDHVDGFDDVIVFLSHISGLVLHRLKALEDIPKPKMDTGVTPDPEAEPILQPPTEPEPIAESELEPSPAPPRTPGLGDGQFRTKAESLLPGGYYSPLGAETFPGVWNHNTYANNSNDFWNPVAVWNPKQQRMYGVLDRTAGPHTQESVVILTYDAPTDSWGNVEVPDLGGDFGSPHVYGRWAFDLGRQKMYRRTQAGDVWVLDLDTHEWTNTGPRNGAWRDGIAMHEGTGELFYMDRDGFVYGWNPDTEQVRTIGQNPAATDRHSHGHYNSVREEVCIAFGDGGDILTLVSADSVRAVTVPKEVRGNAGSATTFTFHDPITGNYLVYATGPDGPRELWEFDPDEDQWAMALDVRDSSFAWPPYHGHLIAPVPDHDVIIWLHRSDYANNRHQGIYKHKSAF